MNVIHSFGSALASSRTTVDSQDYVVKLFGCIEQRHNEKVFVKIFVNFDKIY